MFRADLILKPVSRIILAMAKQNGARIYLPDKIKQFASIGVRGQIEIFDFTSSSHFAATGA